MKNQIKNLLAFLVFIVLLGACTKTEDNVLTPKNNMNYLIQNAVNPYEWVGLKHNEICKDMLRKGYSVFPIESFDNSISQSITELAIFSNVPDNEIYYSNIELINATSRNIVDSLLIVGEEINDINKITNLDFLYSNESVSELDIKFTKRLIYAINYCFHYTDDTEKQFSMCKDSMQNIEQDILLNCGQNSWLPLIAISVAKNSTELWHEQYLQISNNSQKCETIQAASASSIAIVAADCAGAIRGAWYGYQVMKYGGPKAALIGITAVGLVSAARASASFAGYWAVAVAVWDVIKNTEI